MGALKVTVKGPEKKEPILLGSLNGGDVIRLNSGHVALVVRASGSTVGHGQEANNRTYVLLTRFVGGEGWFSQGGSWVADTIRDPLGDKGIAVVLGTLAEIVVQAK